MSWVFTLDRCSPFDAVIMDPEWGGMGDKDDMVCDGGWILGAFCMITPGPRAFIIVYKRII